MKRWLGLLVVFMLPMFIIRAQAAPAYRYMYAMQNFKLDTPYKLYFIDPSDTSVIPQTLVLPDHMYICGDPSPDGQWLMVCYQEGALMLLDLQNGEIRNTQLHVATHYDFVTSEDLEPKWSPDSQYIAAKEGSFYELSSGRVITVPENESIKPYPNVINIVQFLLWIPENHFAVLERNECGRNDGVANCYKKSFELRRVPEMTLQATAEVPAASWDTCYGSASPGGRYIAFEPYCYFAGTTVSFREIFVWDTLQNKVTQLTSNTDPDTDTWFSYPTPYATYNPFWYDQNILLLGVRSETLVYNEGIESDLDTVNARTELYKFDGTEPRIVLDYKVNAWAKNPITGHLAFQKLLTDDQNDRYLITENQISIAIFDGQALTPKFTAQGGCNRLVWSPDGEYLGYGATSNMNTFGNCYHERINSLQFIDANGVVSHYLIPPYEDVYIDNSGWAIAPPVQAKPFFPAGMPTPIPTQACCG